MSARTVETVRSLLATYPDVCQPSSAVDKSRGGDHTSPVLTMDPRYHAGSYQELEACLYALRQQAPSLYWHVRAWWLDARRVRRWTRVRRANQRGRATSVMAWALVPQRDRQADERLAHLGAEWLDAQWRQVAYVAGPGFRHGPPEAPRRGFRDPMLPPDELQAQREPPPDRSGSLLESIPG